MFVRCSCCIAYIDGARCRCRPLPCPYSLTVRGSATAVPGGVYPAVARSAVHDVDLIECPPPTAGHSRSLQLLDSQGAETIGEFLANPSRPKVTLKDWNAAMDPKNFEPSKVTLEFAKCLSMVCIYECEIHMMKAFRYTVRMSMCCIAALYCHRAVLFCTLQESARV